MNEKEKTAEIIERLSPLERKIVPYLNLSFEEIQKKAGTDTTSLFRALKFLESKGLVEISVEKRKMISLGVNGVYYKKSHFPERKLLILLEKEKSLPIEDAKKISKLSDNEFKVSLGVLKNKALIELKEGKIILTAKKEELTKKSLEEIFLDTLPIDETKLSDEQRFAFENLKKRKDIVEVKDQITTSFKLTDLGKKIAGREVENDFLEEVTQEVIKTWKKGGKFRKYDLNFPVPRLYGGRKHFVSEAIQRGKRIWLDMGFKEMHGTKTMVSFWNFDSLFTAQDHSVRDMQDTFFIEGVEGKLPSKNLVSEVKKSHEEGVVGSKGWGGKWDENESRRVVLRTHTTCLSAKTLASLKDEDLPAKFFAIGRNFRNETVDWSHGFEFNQSEGIVIDENANLRNLIGYLKEFAKKMGFEKIRIQPAYFPYTEPSLEGAVWNEEKKTWVEVLAAGIFRPEVTAPLFGRSITVLAWGPGFDRMMMFSLGLGDLREVYKNDLKYLRERKTGI